MLVAYRPDVTCFALPPTSTSIAALVVIALGQSFAIFRRICPTPVADRAE
jgi:hypothetical protein